MKIFGSFKPKDLVVSNESLNNMHLKISSLDDLTDYPEQAIAVLTQDSGKFKAGTVIIKKNGEWIELEEIRESIGPVVKLRGFRIGTNVYLKWHDPIDKTDLEGNVLAGLDHVVVVRKYGAVPENEMDGTIVYSNLRSNRDKFNPPGEGYFIDHAPVADGDDTFYYRLFAVANNGRVNMTSEGVKIAEFTWTEICNIIKEGNASSIFQPGDVFDMGNGIEIVVAAIDKCVAQNTKAHPHLVTFMFRSSVTQLPFDTALPNPKSPYQVTKDTYYKSSKTYYEKQPNGTFKINVGTVGMPIVTELYEIISRIRAESGENLWDNSDVRDWANRESTSGYSEALTRWATIVQRKTGSSPIPPYVLLSNLESTKSDKLVDHIVLTKCTTAYPNISGKGTYDTNDKFFLPSVTELTGNKNDTRVEGNQFDIYADKIEDLIVSEDTLSAGVLSVLKRTNYWTRSPLILSSNDTGTMVNYVNSSGLLTSQDACEFAGCVLAFSIG